MTRLSTLAARWHRVSVVIRRGATTLPAQSVRLSSSSGSRVGSNGLSEAQAGGIVQGAPTLDIQTDDRFTANGVVYRVVFVRPFRTHETIADVEVIE